MGLFAGGSLNCNRLDNVDFAVGFIESDIAVLERKEGVVATHANVLAWVVTCAALAQNDVARYDGLTAEFFDAETL
jgi:hypothetical protein